MSAEPHAEQDTEDAEQYLEAVGFDDLRGDRAAQQYDDLVDTAARYVRDGLYTIEECEPTSLVADGQRPSEAFVERFQRDVSDALDGLADTHAERETARKQRQTTTDPTKIDWPALWENAGVAPTKPLSWTQAALAVDVAEQTPINDQGAKQLLKAAIDAGLVTEFERKQTVVPTEVDR